MPPVEIQRRRAVEFGHLVAPADDRHAIGVVQKQRRTELFGEQRARVAVGSLRALFQDHAALGLDILGRQPQIRHPVGLMGHHQPQPVGRDGLEIGGVVPRGERVLGPAIGGDQPRERAIRHCLGPLEHQMFEEMRDARLARRLVGRTNPVPDHVGDRRGGVILDHHDIEPVVERQGGDPVIAQCQGGARQGKGGKDRVVPLGQRASAWLTKYRDEARPQLVMGRDEGWLFLTLQGEQMEAKRLSERVRSYIRASGTEKSGSCHLFRHTAATLMLENGADIRFIQALLGHESLETTQIYTQVSVTKLAEIHAATHPGARLKPRADGSLEHEESEQSGRTYQRRNPKA